MVVVTLIPEALWGSERAEGTCLISLHCSYSGGLMKIVSFIHERKVIIKILDHLGLGKGAEPKRNRAPPFPVDSCGGTSIEPYDDGWFNMRRILLMCNHCEIALESGSGHGSFGVSVIKYQIVSDLIRLL